MIILQRCLIKKKRNNTKEKDVNKTPFVFLSLLAKIPFHPTLAATPDSRIQQFPFYADDREFSVQSNNKEGENSAIHSEADKQNMK